MGLRNGFDIMIVNCSHYCSATHMSVELGSEKTLCEESLFPCSSLVVYSGQYAFEEAFLFFSSSFLILTFTEGEEQTSVNGDMKYI